MNTNYGGKNYNESNKEIVKFFKEYKGLPDNIKHI